MLHEGPYNIVLGDGLIDEGRRRREAAGTYLGAGEEEAVEPLYDVVSVGGWSYYVEGAAVPELAGVEIVEDFYGQNFPVIDRGLTRAQIEQGQWCWGRGEIRQDGEAMAIPMQTHFSLVITQHGNPRKGWIRIPIEHPNWWHGDEFVPREEIYGRSIGEHFRGGPVCLRLRFGVFEG